MRVVVVVTLVGCYAPSPATGVECSPNNTCPEGQTCNLVTGICDGVTPVDAPGEVAIDAPATLGPWSTPVPIAELNTTSFEGDPSMTADLLELYFVSDRGGTFTSQIYRATRASAQAPFDPPVVLADFQSFGQESGPEISSDGLQLYFHRGGTTFDTDIFRTVRASRQASFGMPAREASLSDNNRDDFNPTVAPSGVFAMVDIEVSASDRDLHYFTRMQVADPWTRIGRVAELSTMVIDAGAVFDASGNTVYFHSNRNGPNELFIATRENKNKPFAAPAPVSELGLGVDPWVSPDQRVIVFVRDNDLFIATR